MLISLFKQKNILISASLNIANYIRQLLDLIVEFKNKIKNIKKLYLSELSKQGGVGRKKLNQITRVVGIALAFLQGYMYSFAYNSYQ